MLSECSYNVSEGFQPFIPCLSALAPLDLFDSCPWTGCDCTVQPGTDSATLYIHWRCDSINLLHWGSIFSTREHSAAWAMAVPLVSSKLRSQVVPLISNFSCSPVARPLNIPGLLSSRIAAFSPFFLQLSIWGNLIAHCQTTSRRVKTFYVSQC